MRAGYVYIVLRAGFAAAAMAASAGMASADDNILTQPENLPNVSADRPYLCLGPSILGTSAQRDFFKTHPEFFPPTHQTFRRVEWTPELKKAAQEINDAVNHNSIWITDQENVGVVDLWMIKTKKKDCEDGVLAKMDELASAREKFDRFSALFPDVALRIATAFDGTEYHALLIINALENGQPVDYVLDNKTDDIKAVDATTYAYRAMTPSGDKSSLRRVVPCGTERSNQILQNWISGTSVEWLVNPWTISISGP